MSDLLTTIEEINIEEMLRAPHLSYVVENLLDRKKIAASILRRNNEEILLIDSSGFLIDSVFAGLTENHIEYIAKNGPRDYKKNLLKILQDQAMMRGVFEIAKAMDEDLGENITQNQDRVKNVVQYIKDNRIAFEF